jgi:hypothetical protein
MEMDSERVLWDLRVIVGEIWDSLDYIKDLDLRRSIAMREARSDGEVRVLYQSIVADAVFACYRQTKYPDT